MITLSHILIGCPSSGKSTVANELIKQDNNYRIVSTDKIREKLFENESIQGDWPIIEIEVFSQIKQHLQTGHPIIYDATNAEKAWRIDLLQKLKQYENIQWIGWHLKTPLNVCKYWNQQRKREVPEDIIEKMYLALQQFPPIVEEGFTSVYPILYSQNNYNQSTIERNGRFLF